MVGSDKPIPFDNVTINGFCLRQNVLARLTVMDVARGTLKTVEGTFSKGHNEVFLKECVADLRYLILHIGDSRLQGYIERCC